MLITKLISYKPLSKSIILCIGTQTQTTLVCTLVHVLPPQYNNLSNPTLLNRNNSSNIPYEQSTIRINYHFFRYKLKNKTNRHCFSIPLGTQGNGYTLSPTITPQFLALFSHIKSTIHTQHTHSSFRYYTIHYS